MQIQHQRMDLDHINETDHEPLKPLNKRNNENEMNSNNIITKPILKKTMKNRTTRTFGQDITNQTRTNKNILQNSNDNTKCNGFNFNKPSIKSCSNTPQKQESLPPKQKQKEIKTQTKTKEEEININYISDITLPPWDMNDINNDLYVTDYVSDIMNHLREDENTNRNGCIIANIDFMDLQNDVNARMRTVLVDWLVEVHRKFKLCPATYFLAINLLDRYLAKRQLHRRKLQLCGCTCLWIASKYHEIYAPEMDDFIYISDNAFDDQELIEMEIEILKTLSFTLTVPTVYNFAQRYTRISSYYLKKKKEMKIINDLIMYCMENCVINYELCRRKPSLIGAACFVYSCISTKVFDLNTFKNDNIEKVIGYKFEELIDIMKQVDKVVKNAKKSKHKAILKKYCNTKYSNIGKLNFSKLNTSFLN